MSDDPFEDALNAMGDGDEGDAAAKADDPFSSALETLEQESGELAEDSAVGDETASALESQEGDAPAGDVAVDPFEAAMSAMDGGGEPAAADPFESALQVAKSEHHVAPASKNSPEYNIDIDFLMDIKLEVTFEVGRAKMFISDLLSLGQGSVIELHRLVGEELEIFVNGHLFATGEVVVVNEKFGARITQIIAPEKRIQRLGTHAIM